MKTGKRVKRIIGMILSGLLILQYASVAPASAAEAVQPAPKKLRVEAIHRQEPNVEPAIGYNEFDKNYADLISDKLDMPTGVSAPRLFLNYYVQEVNKPYKPVKPTVLKVRDVPAETSGNNMLRLDGLESGTVYYAYTKAYYTHTKETTTYTSSESSPSNTVKFMTDIAINAYSYGPNQIKIEWDDVWNSGKRMDYKLYISENKAFTNSQPIYIGSEQIGQNGPVTANEASGKLEYIHKVRDPGRVYYIKVVPDTTETEMKRSAESRTIAISSFILARTTKMSTTDAGTVWKVEWSPVVTGLADKSIKISYQIYRGDGTGGGIEQYMASVDDTTFFLTLQPGQEQTYYTVKATVTRNGQELYPGIRIQSQRIYVKESEVASTPPVPELVPEFSNAGTTVISYQNELKPDSATILWRVPLKGNGEVDTDIKYDIWLINDPNMLNEPPENTRIASSVKMNHTNYVMSGTRLMGYKYIVKDLVPNSTYYFKIVAKKDYVEFAGDEIANITLESEAAMKVIITPAHGPIDQPIVPARPPFAMKLDRQGKDMVTSTSAVVTLQNKWYEQYTIMEGGKAAWIYRTPEQIRQAGLAMSPAVPDLVAAIENGTADPLKFRKVEYDNGVTLDVGCAEYSPDMDFGNLENMPTSKITNFPTTANDPEENMNAPGTIPDGKKHKINIVINELSPNKTYIVWVRAARRSVNLISGPSDPIIVTTLPNLPASAEKPTVPVFNYYYAGDTYVDLGWNFNSRYVYYLEYATVDNRNKVSGREEITPDELENANHYRVGGLAPDTVYYFWIQAEATNSSGVGKRSDYSDSLIIRTEKTIPPETPKGFGVSGTAGSVAKDRITYEWMALEGLEYILEIDDAIDYKGSRKIEIEDASAFTVDQLRSNFRYYARLYAYDPVKKQTSEPTASVTVRTLRSSDDYDSDADTENVISGSFILREPAAVNGLWTVQVTGVNADRFIRHVQTDRMLDYLIDLTKVPTGTKKINVKISMRVFEALGQTGENLLLKTQKNTLIIRPGVMADEKGGYTTAGANAEAVFGITPDSGTVGNGRNLTFKSPVSELEIGISSGFLHPLEKFHTPMKVVYEYQSAGWYKPGITAGYALAAGKAEWTKAVSSGSYDSDTGMGTLTFETEAPGKLAVADIGKDFFDDISGSYAKKSIQNVVSVHKLRSVTGRSFGPARNLTVGDAAEFMLDMLEVDYDTNAMTMAVKSGIVQSSDANQENGNCTREMLIAMAMRVYELKTSSKAKGSKDDVSVYKDIGQTAPAFLPKIRFASEIGVITYRFHDTLGPKDTVMRAEAMVLLEKLLRYTGEL